MRILLAAIGVEEADLAGNLAAHAVALEEAATARADLAVFPARSLTGRHAPAHPREASSSLDTPVVRDALVLTQRVGVPALFGVAESVGRDGRACSTQVYAHGGRVGGVARTCVGGGDGGGDAAGAVVRLGAATFGIHAELGAGVDAPAAELAAAGARLVCVGAHPAPDLDAVVAGARRHRHWVALAGPAGPAAPSTEPGLAALVDPAGAVVARRAGERPGTLVVDVPVAVEVTPTREAVRVVVLDGRGRALLVRYHDPETGASWWCPPGGGLEVGEDHRAAARREVAEELGRDDLVPGGWIGGRTHTFWFGGRWLTQRERWMHWRAPAFEVTAHARAVLADEGVDDVRWWTADELRAARVVTAPRALPALIDALAGGDVPDADTDVGV